MILRSIPPAATAAAVLGLLAPTGPTLAGAAFPAIDIARICTGAAVAVDAGRAEAACRRQEAEARVELRARWAKLSAAERSVCVGDAELGTARSYADMLGCIDTSRELGREKAMAGGAAGSAGRPDVGAPGVGLSVGLGAQRP